MLLFSCLLLNCGAGTKPLADLCRQNPCKDFASTSAELEACGKSGKCAVASVGSCGEWKFTDKVEGFSATQSYFGAEGSLVAACMSNIEGKESQCYGERPSCQVVVEKTFGAP